MSLCTVCRVSLPCLCEQPAPSPQPEMPETLLVGRLLCDHCKRPLLLTVSELRALLAAQGLHIIDAQQKAVLEACEALMACTLRPGGVADNYTDFEKVAKAELARRKL